jgi:hypothetical protein
VESSHLVAIGGAAVDVAGGGLAGMARMA